jgi:hypothetical protein
VGLVPGYAPAGSLSIFLSKSFEQKIEHNHVEKRCQFLVFLTYCRNFMEFGKEWCLTEL